MSTSNSSTTALPPISEAARRRAARASLAGTIVEYYEFTVYGYLAVVFGPLFFPAASTAAATLSALAVYGAGYLARPLGGLVFGALGDRFGRRPVLLATLTTMGVASSLIGVLPTYDAIGLAAPVLLLVLRLAQGFSAGGEWAGALTYVAEMAPPRKRALYAAMPAMGVGLGYLAATSVVALVSSAGLDMTAWGWRVPFLLCIPLTGLCILLRYRLEDSPEFKLIAESAEGVSRTPVREVLRHHSANVLRVTALTIGTLGPGVLGKLYLAIYLIQERGFRASEVYVLLCIAFAATIWLFPFMGAKADRFGRRTVAWTGLAAFAVLPVPLFLWLSAADGIWAVAPAVLIYVAVEPFVSAAVYTGYTDLFPARTRLTGVAIGVNLGTIVTAGFGPVIATYFATATQWPGAPGLWGTACALLGMVALAATKNTGEDRRLR